MRPNQVYRQTVRRFLAPVVPFLDDPTVSEIMVVGHATVYCERQGRLSRVDARFVDESALMAAVHNLAGYVGREIGEYHHSMHGRLPTGERVHAIIPPASRNGVCLTIRKFQPSCFDIVQLVAMGVLSADAARFLARAVLQHRNIVIAGGSGSGKTTMLNVLSKAIPVTERIIVIEDSPELQMQQPHAVYLEAQAGGPDGRPVVTIRDLFVDSLRMRADRIVVGEVQRDEALDLVQAMISGHPGTLTTVHASSPRDAAARLETLCLLSDMDLPLHVARAQVASAIHLVVQLARFPDGSRRVVEIAECLGLDRNDQYVWNSLFAHGLRTSIEVDSSPDCLAATGNQASFIHDPGNGTVRRHGSCDYDSCGSS